MSNEEIINKKIEEAEVITIWGHALPDGDCFGCQIGLREVLRVRYPHKKVYAIGSGIPALAERLGVTDQVKDEEIQKSLAILVDVSCLRRVEDQRITMAKDWIKFDHHLFNEGESFPYPGLVDSERVSASEIIAEWADRNGYPFNKVSAEAFFLGIFTDSGSFKFHGTCPKTFETAGKLFSYGVVPYSLLSPLYEMSIDSVKFRAFLVEQAIISNHVCYVYLRKEQYMSQHIKYEEASSMVGILAGYKTPIYCLFTEAEDGSIRGELRSERGYPVQPTAKAFGGGGHLFAAGLTLSVDHGPTINEVVAALNQVEKLKNWGG